jgi:hypothetical protein
MQCIKLAAIAGLLVALAHAPAQGQVVVGNGAVAVQAPGVGVIVAAQPEQWRYKTENGRSWYWAPDNRWMWYNGTQWIYYVPEVTTTVPYTTYYSAPSYSYTPSYSYGYSYPTYYGGYYRPYYGGYYRPWGYGYRGYGRGWRY